MSWAKQTVDLQGVVGPHGQFNLRHKVISVEITKYLKRLRKNTGDKLRYMLVAEAHKSGLPHYHALIHEGRAGGVTWRDLSSAWKWGFTKFKLVEDPHSDASKFAFYCAKYLAKDARARVRASLHYGSPLGDSGGEVRVSTTGSTEEQFSDVALSQLLHVLTYPENSRLLDE